LFDPRVEVRCNPGNGGASKEQKPMRKGLRALLRQSEVVYVHGKSLQRQRIIMRIAIEDCVYCVYYNAYKRRENQMPGIETNTKKIVARLDRDGWTSEHGGEHDLYRHPGFPGVRIVVPRHKELSIGVARKIAKQAGW
jgi:predicted RNA binding protein YcfA (HicA-like mRNA interferase family)